MIFETKIVIIVRDELLVWQKLNVASFLSGGIAGLNSEVIGEPYRDANGTTYGSLIRQPILIFEANGEGLGRTLKRALEHAVSAHIYTREMFATGHDEANRAVVAAIEQQHLDLVGMAFIAPRSTADKVTKGLKLHP